MVTHILVGIDGSEPARRAAHHARDLARQCGARLTLVLAVEPPSAAALPPFDAVTLRGPHPGPEALRAAQILGEQVVAELGADRAEVVVAVGAAAESLLAEARRHHADLLVVGARGLGAAERLLLGSVSERVLYGAECPVLVVR
jgi:nucleotide-binding universal stress UspA family protein